MGIQHILFDLDGTLLPMVQDEFVKFYMPLLAKEYISRGVEIEPERFIGAVWAGYKAMVKNDGSRTNREAFWSYIDPELPIGAEESEKIAEEFYGGEFNQAVCTTRPTPLADQIVKTVKGKGLGTYLVSRLTDELMERDIVPFYSASVTNIGSQRTAHRSGYIPVWVDTFGTILDGSSVYDDIVGKVSF